MQELDSRGNGLGGMYTEAGTIAMIGCKAFDRLIDGYWVEPSQGIRKGSSWPPPSISLGMGLYFTALNGTPEECAEGRV